MLKNIQRLDFCEKVKYFMMYVENNEIPSGRAKLKFSEMYSYLEDDANVGIWFQSYLAQYKERLLYEVEKYKDIYPVAYQKVIKRVNRKQLDYSKRVEALMRYINKDDLKVKQKTTFQELLPSSNDQTVVNTWLDNQIVDDYEKLLIEVCKYKTIYEEAYRKMALRINNYMTKSNAKKLSDEELICVYMKYLETSGVIVDSSHVKFKEIADNVDDYRIVSRWLNNQLLKNQENIKLYCEKYKDVYPVGYEKIIKKINSRNYSGFKNDSVRAYLLLKYCEDNPVPSQLSYLTFFDINNKCYDYVRVGLWIHKCMLKDLSLFIEEIDKYKEIFPGGYKKMCSKINDSSVRIKKERLELIAVLKNVKLLLEHNDGERLLKIRQKTISK